jgi:hypothetical protein
MTLFMDYVSDKLGFGSRKEYALRWRRQYLVN